MNLSYLLGAVLIGMTFALQPAINSVAAKTLGSPVSAAVISVAITLMSCIALLPLFGATLETSAIVKLPWWVIFGGFIGAGVVAGGAAIAPVTGAAAFFVCMIAGQLIASALVDHFGAFGFPKRPADMLRVLGILLVLVGAILVQVSKDA